MFTGKRSPALSSLLRGRSGSPGQPPPTGSASRRWEGACCSPRTHSLQTNRSHPSQRAHRALHLPTGSNSPAFRRSRRPGRGPAVLRGQGAAGQAGAHGIQCDLSSFLTLSAQRLGTEWFRTAPQPLGGLNCSRDGREAAARAPGLRLAQQGQQCPQPRGKRQSCHSGQRNGVNSP